MTLEDAKILLCAILKSVGFLNMTEEKKVAFLAHLNNKIDKVTQGGTAV